MKDNPYNNRKWQKVRRMKLMADPLCERCEANGRIITAMTVHHRDHDAFNNRPENLESLCRPCHEQQHGRLMVGGCDLDGMPLDEDHHWNRQK